MPVVLVLAFLSLFLSVSSIVDGSEPLATDGTADRDITILKETILKEEEFMPTRRQRVGELEEERHRMCETIAAQITPGIASSVGAEVKSDYGVELRGLLEITLCSLFVQDWEWINTNRTMPDPKDGTLCLFSRQKARGEGDDKGLGGDSNTSGDEGRSDLLPSIFPQEDDYDAFFPHCGGQRKRQGMGDDNSSDESISFVFLRKPNGDVMQFSARVVPKEWDTIDYLSTAMQWAIPPFYIVSVVSYFLQLV